MPLNDDGLISREPDGSYREDYCKWCYADAETRREQFDLYLSQLKHWK